MVPDLGLQLLDAARGDGPVLDDAVSFLYEPLQVPHFLFVLLVLHHRLLRRTSLQSDRQRTVNACPSANSAPYCTCRMLHC